MSTQGRTKKSDLKAKFEALASRGLMISANYEGFDTVDPNISTPQARSIKIPNVTIISHEMKRTATSDLRQNTTNRVLMHVDELTAKALLAPDVLQTTKDRINNAANPQRLRPSIGDCLMFTIDDYDVGDPSPPTDRMMPDIRAYSIESIRSLMFGDTPLAYIMELVAS